MNLIGKNGIKKSHIFSPPSSVVNNKHRSVSFYPVLNHTV